MDLMAKKNRENTIRIKAIQFVANAAFWSDGLYF